jgi:hypothetical protein
MSPEERGHFTRLIILKTRRVNLGNSAKMGKIDIIIFGFGQGDSLAGMPVGESAANRRAGTSQ